MKIILFGATGMVGQGVLRECLLDPAVTEILSIVRSPSGQAHSKLRELFHADFFNFSDLELTLTGYDACFFCLGVSSFRMPEPEYTRLTYDLTLGIAQMLAPRNPTMTFVYVSGTGTDSSEKSTTMWARVKGKTENALARLPFAAVYLFRPGYIQPLHQIKSKTPIYRAIYAVVAPLYPVLRSLAPNFVTTTEQVGKAMLAVAKTGAPKRILENKDINALGN